jgi:uncharacterized protein with HEPN domain
MSNRKPEYLLEDMLNSAEKILSYTKDITFEEFASDSKTIDAVIRNFEIIGEAANRLPQQFRDENESIDWFRIRGFRNRIVHDYFGIDHEIVWKIKEDQLHTLSYKSKIF